MELINTWYRLLAIFRRIKPKLSSDGIIQDKNTIAQGAVKRLRPVPETQECTNSPHACQPIWIDASQRRNSRTADERAGCRALGFRAACRVPVVPSVHSRDRHGSSKKSMLASMQGCWLLAFRNHPTASGSDFYR